MPRHHDGPLRRTHGAGLTASRWTDDCAPSRTADASSDNESSTEDSTTTESGGTDDESSGNESSGNESRARPTARSARTCYRLRR